MSEPVQLPNAIITGFGVQQIMLTGSEGEQHAVVAMTCTLAISADSVAEQTLLLHKDDVVLLRQALKNPPKQPNPDQTTLPIEENQ